MAKTHSSEDQPLSFLVVARTPFGGPWPHPIEVTLHPDGARSIMGFSLGPHAANVGGQVPLSRVVDADGLLGFREEFDAGDLHWIVPYLVRLLAGEDTTEEIIAAYREHHGKAPGWTGQHRFVP